MKRILKLLPAFVLLIFMQCTEEIKPEGPDYYHIFTGKNKKTWRITKVAWTGEGKSDVTLSFSSCYRDDIYAFYANKDNQYEVTGGAQKCSGDESTTLVSDTWSFVNATATLNIIIPLFSDSTLPFYLIKASSSEMVLEIYLDQDNIYSYQVTMQSVSEE